MPSLREIRRKIKSVKSTQQITRAMKMVAAARMRRAQAAILASRPFAVKMEQAVRSLAADQALAREYRPDRRSEAASKVADVPEGGEKVTIHPFFDGRLEGRPCLLLVTGDKGLCGAFNSNAIRAALDWLRQRRGQRTLIAAVGRKGRDFIHRVRDADVELLTEMVGIFPKVSYAQAEILGKALIDAYLEGGAATIDVIYNEFKSVASQRLVTARILPIPPSTAEETALNAGAADFKFEPGREDLLAALLPRHIKAQLYRILLESQAAELAARMNAMDSASKNAGDLIGDLTLGLNRSRQAMITGEIAELVGGAEALAA